MSLNEKDALEFFNQVKGKKIRWSTWKNVDYFVPKVYNYPYITGVEYDNGKMINSSRAFTISNGFDLDINGCWQYHNELDKLVHEVNSARKKADLLFSRYADKIERLPDGTFKVKDCENV